MFRKADYKDLDDIMKIISSVVDEMKSYGSDQWDESYPQKEDFYKDIENGELYIYEENCFIKGFICINEVQCTEYENLKWSLNKKCIIIHRTAVNPVFRKQGIGTKLILFAESYAMKKGIFYIRTDTYSKNIKMNSLFKKLRYTYVGDMSYRNKKLPFKCYDKILK